MMQKRITGSMLFLLMLLLCSTQPGLCAEQTPEKLVDEFYQWYFKADVGETLAENKDEIYKYVAKETVDLIRGGHSTRGIAYFVQFGLDSWINPKAVVRKSTKIDDNLFVVPVTFTFENGNYHVVVFVERKNGTPYIIKVTDIFPYY